MHIELSLALPRDALTVPVVRRVLAQSLGALGVETGCVDDIQLAVSEACTNVLDHAQDGDDFEVVASIDDTGCVVEVRDVGVGFATAAVAGRADAHVEAESGRGVQLMRALVDELAFEPGDARGTVVRMRKALAFAVDSPLPTLAGS